MPTFQYRGRNQRGEAVQGRVEALTAEAVATQLFNTGITPIDINEAAVGGDVLRSLRVWLGRDKVRLIDLIFFSRQMYTMYKAGVPIMQALRGLRESTPNPAMARVLQGVSDSLDAGLDLSSAVRRHPDVFSTLFVSMVQVGESTGSLEQTFLQLALYLEREKDTRERIKAALRYPIFVLVAIGIAMFIINLFVIPAFAKVYAGFHAQLPWATRILMAVSGFTVAYWYLILGAVVGGVLGFRYYIATPAGRYWWDSKKLTLPVVGRILYQATLARFTRSMAITIKAGVPLVAGMTAVARAVDNVFIGERIVQMRDGVERGENIARTAIVTGLFPALVVQMITVGEETGAMDAMMQEVSEYYEREVDYAIKNLSAAIEPILITAIGVMVLILALGVFLPMWDLATAVRGR